MVKRSVVRGGIRPSWRVALSLLVLSALLGGSVREASAVITGASVASSALSGSGNTADGSTTGGAAIQTNNGINLNTRFEFNVNSDIGIFSTDDQSGAATHGITFNATAPGGYRLDITTSRVGDMNRINDLVGCNGAADITGVGASTNTPLNSGSITLPDPGGIGNGDSTTSTPFSQSSGTATIFRVSNNAAQAHSLSFTWSATTRSNSCEAAVRVGAQNGTTTGCTACVYPGSPSRTQATDGHFVQITFTSLCGNGVVDASVSEQCDQGVANGTATSCCSTACQFKAAGIQCRANAGACDQPEQCTGASATCPGDTFLPIGTVCRPGSPGEVCDLTELCTGTATCPPDQVLPNGTLCRSVAGVCDVAEFCDGANKFCPADAKSTALCRASVGACDVAENCNGFSNDCPNDGFQTGSVCRASAGACDLQETCPGNSPNCPADAFRNPFFVCRAASGVCDVTETCPGNGPNCPGDAFQPSGTTCTSDSNPCTVDECDGANNCLHPAGNAGATCRTAASGCDLAETCDGSSTSCPADAVRPSGASCLADGNPCTLDQCDGVTINCQHPAGNAGFPCRGAAGVCDLAEACDGLSTNCPADTVKASGTACTGDGNPCTLDECDGVSTACQHPAGNAGAQCRAAADVCDVAEQCDGASTTCPTDGFEPSSTVCRAASPGEVCDVTENCTGSGPACPADAVEPAGTLCRAINGVCDVSEDCDGVGKLCPTDGFASSSTQCRGAAAECDAAENCTGSGPNCPADAKQPSGTMCRAAAGVCDVTETCDGVSNTCPVDAFAASSVQCRAANGVCDMAENCTGSGAACPADAFQPDGTGCDDPLFCNGAESCLSGACQSGGAPCGGGQSCDESTDQCFSGQCPINAVSCRTALKSVLVIKDKADNTKDKLIWKWIKGQSTTQMEFADPTTTATYALCFYKGPNADLIGGVEVPPSNTLWKIIGTKGYKYRDPAGSQDSVTKVLVKGSTTNKSKALVKGKGNDLTDFTLPIVPGDLPLIAQLRNNQTGICWEGSYATPVKNQVGKFKGKQ